MNEQCSCLTFSVDEKHKTIIPMVDIKKKQAKQKTINSSYLIQ